MRPVDENELFAYIYLNNIISYLLFGWVDWQICTRLLLITEYISSESAEFIRDHISIKVKEVMGLSIECEWGRNETTVVIQENSML